MTERKEKAYNIPIKKGEQGMDEDMTRDEFKTIMEMVRMIVESATDKKEALKKIDSLTILKDKTDIQ